MPGARGRLDPALVMALELLADGSKIVALLRRAHDMASFAPILGVGQALCAVASGHGEHLARLARQTAGDRAAATLRDVRNMIVRRGRLGRGERWSQVWPWRLLPAHV